MKTEPVVKATDWTEEQNKVIEMYQTKLAMSRSNAIRKLRTEEQKGRTAAQQLAGALTIHSRPAEPKSAKPTPIRQPKELNKRLAEMGDKAPHIAKAKAKPATKEPAFNTKPAGKGDAYTVEGRGGKYDRQLVVNLYMDAGKTPVEIAKLGSAGIKGISPVYCHRILFGNEESGGINNGQAARRKEQAARVKAWAAEKAKESK